MAEIKRALINTIADYFDSSCKQPSEERIGAEIEHFVTGISDGKTVNYFGDDGVGGLIEALGRDNRRGWKLHYENRYPLSLSRTAPSGVQTVTLEPGAQLEYSTSPCRTIPEIGEEYDAFLADVNPLLDARGQTLETWGYQPVSHAREIPFIPKKKYHYMANYFLNKGKLAHNMMKGTAATHITVDYFDESDFSAKLRLATTVTPLFAVLFNNTPAFEGRPYSGYAIRLTIWDNCDPHRCGLLPGVFDSGFGFEQFASWFINLKPIVFYDGTQYQYTGEQKLWTLLAQQGKTEQTIGEALRMVFTDVRVKQFLELRMVDALPREKMLQYAALVYELFYNRDLFEEAADYFLQFGKRDVLRARSEVPEKGPAAAMGKGTIGSTTGELLKTVKRLCSEENRPCLQPLFTETKTEPERAQCGTC